MTGAHTRRAVVILVVLAMGLSVAVPAVGAATATPDGGSDTTFGDGLDGSDDTNDSTDSDGGLLEDDSDDSSTDDDSGDDTASSDGDGSDGDSSTDGDGSEDDDGLSIEDDDSDDEGGSGDSSLADGGSDGGDGSDDATSTDSEAVTDWSIPEVATMRSTAEVAGTETTVSVSPSELHEDSVTPDTLVDLDRTVPATTTGTDTTLSTYELQVGDLSEGDTGALLEVEASGGSLSTTTGAVGSMTDSAGSVGDSLSTLEGTDGVTTTSGSSDATAASVDAARVRDGSDRTTGATGGTDGPGGTGTDDAAGSGAGGSAAVAAQQPDRQALGPSVPADGLPVPSDPAGLGVALGTTALAAAVIRQSTALSGMAGGVATSMGATATTGSGPGVLERLARMLAPFRYSRYDDSDPLEHEARDAMFEVVEESPGTYLSEIADRAEIPLSTARHHIRVLEREDLVSGAKVRGKRRFYPAYTDGIELAAAMNDESTAAVIDALARLGAASVSDLADELGRDPSTISHHVQRLEEDDVIVRERDGRAVMNKLSSAARTMLDPEETPAEPSTAGEAMASD